MIFHAVILSFLILGTSSLKAPASCATTDLGKKFCTDCQTVAVCDTVDVAPVTTNKCSIGKVCGAIAGTVDCISDRAGTPCECNKPICDPFSAEASLAVCSPAGIVAIFPCTGTTNACVSGTCVVPGSVTTVAPPPTTESLKDSCAADSYPVGVLFPRPSVCRSGVFCLSDDNGVDAGVKCSETEYFNGNTAKCESLPVDNCAGCAQALCPDKTDCSQYAICQNGIQQELNKCNGDTPTYDAGNRKCVIENDKLCDPTTKCIFQEMNDRSSSSGSSSGNPSDSSSRIPSGSQSSGPPSSEPSSSGPLPSGPSSSGPPPSGPSSSGPSPSGPSSSGPPPSGSSSTDSSSGGESSSSSTNTRPATCNANNLYFNYPYPGDCKKYWACRQISSTSYTYIVGQCNSNRVFNPATSTCDSPANVTC